MVKTFAKPEIFSSPGAHVSQQLMFLGQVTNLGLCGQLNGDNRTFLRYLRVEN